MHILSESDVKTKTKASMTDELDFSCWAATAPHSEVQYKLNSTTFPPECLMFKKIPQHIGYVPTEKDKWDKLKNNFDTLPLSTFIFF